MRLDWILPQALAGSGRPGLLEAIEDDLDFLERIGFDLVVNLTQVPLVPPAPTSFEIEHFPIPDMGVPTPRAMHEVCSRAVQRIERGDKVLVHCRAGLGRTGLFIACCLVHRGMAPDAAIIDIRLINRRFIQSLSQERFVHHYAEYLDSATAASPSSPMPITCTFC